MDIKKKSVVNNGQCSNNNFVTLLSIPISILGFCSMIRWVVDDNFRTYFPFQKNRSDAKFLII